MWSHYTGGLLMQGYLSKGKEDHLTGAGWSAKTGLTVHPMRHRLLGRRWLAHSCVGQQGHDKSLLTSNKLGVETVRHVNRTDGRIAVWQLSYTVYTFHCNLREQLHVVFSGQNISDAKIGNASVLKADFVIIQTLQVETLHCLRIGAYRLALGGHLHCTYHTTTYAGCLARSNKSRETTSVQRIEADNQCCRP